MEGLYLYINLIEVISGVSLITLAIFSQFTLFNDKFDNHTLTSKYHFEFTYLTIGIMLLVLHFYNVRISAEVRQLLFQLMIPVQIVLLFWTTVSPFTKWSKDNIIYTIKWQTGYLFLLSAVSAIHYNVADSALNFLYCILIGIFVFHSNYLTVRTFRTNKKETGKPDKGSLMVIWAAICLFILFFCMMNLSEFAKYTNSAFILTMTALYFIYAIKYHNYIRTASGGKKSPQPVQQKERADTAKRVPAESAQRTEAEKVTYEVTTTEERIKKKLEEWVEEKGYENNGITINDLSKRIGINRTYLSRYINENYSCNFNCWINKLRVSEAERIMRLQPDLPLSEIAEQVGYADISHFSKQFKAINGDSPSTFEKKIRQKAQLSKRTQ